MKKPICKITVNSMLTEKVSHEDVESGAVWKDIVAVVRCKRCKYYDPQYCGEGFGWCTRNGTGHGTHDDWFCADGERGSE